MKLLNEILYAQMSSKLIQKYDLLNEVLFLI